MPYTEKKDRNLNIYIKQTRQSLVLLAQSKDDFKLFGQFRDKLRADEKVLYLDFANIHSAREFAQELLTQYKQLIDTDIDLELSCDDYLALSDLLKLLDKAQKQDKSIVVWFENFTNILSLDESDWLFGLLRGELQHFQNIVCVFTSDSKEKINAIFMNRDNPFFRFARII